MWWNFLPVNCKSRHDFSTPIIQIPIKTKKKNKNKEKQVKEKKGVTCIIDDYVVEETLSSLSSI
jgi:hypothetical protein